ncbi:MAG: RadC family protein [Cellvibrionaceae bacterium]
MNQNEKNIISLAINILESELKGVGVSMNTPNSVRDYLRLNIEILEHEVFSVMFLDTQNRLIEYKEMFRGTIDSASVYPREIVKTGLKLNAAAVIFTHNHPSGYSEPSQADVRLTARLKDALSMVEIRVLDHIIVGRGEITSFSERGLF